MAAAGTDSEVFEHYVRDSTRAGEPFADGFDGAGMVFFRDLDHARTARATPEVLRDAARNIASMTMPVRCWRCSG